MAAHLDILAQEIATYAAQARHVMLAARCMEQGPPTDHLERENCVLYLLEVAEDLAAQAEHAADALACALELIERETAPKAT
jgi:hypothetical protein